ncbi:hypothetical protein K439DRAFT_838825 [Ramaria rubella]|nr:hypothetical protein K439DRAFT_838825 [Ramaria rubella]
MGDVERGGLARGVSRRERRTEATHDVCGGVVRRPAVVMGRPANAMHVDIRVGLGIGAVLVWFFIVVSSKADGREGLARGAWRGGVGGGGGAGAGRDIVGGIAAREERGGGLDVGEGRRGREGRRAVGPVAGTVGIRLGGIRDDERAQSALAREHGGRGRRRREECASRGRETRRGGVSEGDQSHQRCNSSGISREAPCLSPCAPRDVCRLTSSSRSFLGPALHQISQSLVVRCATAKCPSHHRHPTESTGLVTTVTSLYASHWIFNRGYRRRRFGELSTVAKPRNDPFDSQFQALSTTDQALFSQDQVPVHLFIFSKGKVK